MQPAVAVYQSASPAPARERSLVLRSQGIVSEVLRVEGRYVLVVAEEQADAARAELNTYDAENADWPPKTRPIRFDYREAWPGVFAYMLTVLTVGWIVAADGGSAWFQGGKVDAALIRDGQWWRAFTALTLHLDVAHLASNLAFGGLFGYFAGRYFGSGYAWLVILLAGGAGNVLNSFLMPATHTSVGASTAIFAALGMLAAFVWRRDLFPRERWARRLGPVVAGIAILAYTGTGGERTDVSAHLTGFTCGFGAGVLLAAVLHRLPRTAAAQWLAGAAGVGILVLAWSLALAQYNGG